MTDGMATVDGVLLETLRYREVLGAVAVSREGLVVGSAGISREDAEVVGALGASLVGVGERTARRLGAGVAADLNLRTSEGAIHLRSGGDVAVVLFTEHCDSGAVSRLSEATVQRISGMLAER